MKILFVLDNYYPFIGGAEVLFKNLCEGLAGGGHDVTVITSLMPGTPKEETINSVKVRRVRTPHKASRYWFTYLAVPLAVKMAGSADIINTTTYNGAFPAILAAKLRQKKCLITVLEIIGEHWKEIAGMGKTKAVLYQFLERLIVKLPFDQYCAISNYTAECIRQAGVKNKIINIIYPGIDYQLFDKSAANGTDIRNELGIHDIFVYMYYGRPGISKGAEYLVKAVPLISEKIQNSKLVMILAHEPADGYKNIQQLISGLKQQDNILLVDPVRRNLLPSYIAAADCVVVPSLSEGFGFSAAEACAMERPVVVSNVASLPEVVSGKHILVEPGNSRAIALGVEAVYNDKVRYTDKKLFKWPDCVNAYENIYSRLSGGKKGEQR